MHGTAPEIFIPVDMVGVELVEDVVLVSRRIVHRRAGIVQPAGRSVDMAVRSPSGEESVVARGADLIGIDGRAFVVSLSQGSRERRKQSGTEAEILHHGSLHL